MMINNENLIKALGIESLPDEMKAQILDNSLQIIEQRLMLRLLKALTEEKRDQFSALADTGNQEQMNNFVLENAPDFPDWIIEETNTLKEELKSLNQNLN